ncbi:hypothetical protein [Mycobacterium ahvazicum]|uniref:hypothetical protein n=1 Tax=Mycobacterium ahvazicum TaxID=1964395 RepID=UPI001A9C2A03
MGSVPRRRGLITLSFAYQLEVDSHGARTGGIGAVEGSREVKVSIVEPAVENGGRAGGERSLRRFHHIGDAEDLCITLDRSCVTVLERSSGRITGYHNRNQLDDYQ